MTISDYSMTTLKAAQANTLVAVTSQIADLNNNLKTIYLTTFNNWAENVMIGRSDPAVNPPPQPPAAYIIGYFNDPTTGPGSFGPYGDSVVQWAYPMQGKDPECPMPPLPTYTKPFVPPVLPEPDNIRNVPAGDTMPVGYQLTAPDGSRWQKQASPTPFGMAYYYAKVA